MSEPQPEPEPPNPRAAEVAGLAGGIRSMVSSPRTRARADANATWRPPGASPPPSTPPKPPT